MAPAQGGGEEALPAPFSSIHQGTVVFIEQRHGRSLRDSGPHLPPFPTLALPHCLLVPPPLSPAPCSTAHLAEIERILQQEQHDNIHEMLSVCSKDLGKHDNMTRGAGRTYLGGINAVRDNIYVLNAGACSQNKHN